MRSPEFQFYIIASNDYAALLTDVKGKPHKRVKGGYTMDSGERVVEDSVLVFTNDEAEMVALCKKHTQESILKVSSMKEADLIFSDGSVRYAGRFRSTDKTTALSNSGWTYDPVIDTYFVCE